MPMLNVDLMSPKVRGLYVVFWARRPPASEHKIAWRYAACESKGQADEIYQQKHREFGDEVGSVWLLNMIDTNDRAAPNLPLEVERGIFEQRGGLEESACKKCGYNPRLESWHQASLTR